MTIPLVAYTPSARRLIVPWYEIGGITRFTRNGDDFRFLVVDHTGRLIRDKKLNAAHWRVQTKLELPRDTSGDRTVFAGVRCWRMLAAQEPQTALHAADWNMVLAHLDSYDLNRNPEWPFQPGAVWLERNKGCSWNGFLLAINHVLNGAPWPLVDVQLEPYLAVIEKYGDKLNKLIKGVKC